METCEECGRPNHAGGGRDAEAHCYGTDTVECVRHALTRERATLARLTAPRKGDVWEDVGTGYTYPVVDCGPGGLTLTDGAETWTLEPDEWRDILERGEGRLLTAREVRLTEERDRAVRHSTDMESRMWAAVTRAEAAETRERALREECARVPGLVRLAFDDGWVGYASHVGHGRVRPPPDAEFCPSEAADRLTRWLTTLPAEAPETTEAAPGRAPEQGCGSKCPACGTDVCAAYCLGCDTVLTAAPRREETPNAN